MPALSMTSLNKVISLVTRAHASCAPLARTKKPAWKNLSFISGVTRTLSVSASSHLNGAGEISCGGFTATFETHRSELRQVVAALEHLELQLRRGAGMRRRDV